MPIYDHDCQKCQFLDTISSKKNSINGVTEVDLYYCDNKPTIIVRWGNGPHEYTSGISFWRTNPFIAFGIILAKKRGFNVSKYGEFLAREINK